VTPAKVARIFAACSTPARALRASERVRALGQPALADALYAHAMGLRAVGYPAVQATYRQARDEALSGASVAQ
jgi:hypothetical protein